MPTPTPLARYTWSYGKGRATLSASENGLIAFTPAAALAARAHWETPAEQFSIAGCGFGIEQATNWLDTALLQIDEYLAGTRQHFIVPFDLAGTEFDRSVWRLLQEIPYGETVTYGRVAQALGRPGAARAVANACGRNPLPLFIPCHRVVAQNGPGGYHDVKGVQTKIFLLRHEGVRI